jgi:hypothetical protein
MSSSQFILSSTSNKTFEKCDISLTIFNNNPVPSNSFINVTIPSEIGLSDNVICNLPCNKIDSQKIKV